MSTSVRPAKLEDCPVLVELIRELARYEKLEDEARATVEDLAVNLFGGVPRAEALIAEHEGRVAGFALFFHNFSTFQGKPGIYLEDLFVRPSDRGLGLGKRLLVHLARLAVERGCGRFEWAVLDWNEPAIGFYRSLGARPMDDWTVFRVDAEGLRRLATASEGDPMGDEGRR